MKRIKELIKKIDKKTFRVLPRLKKTILRIRPVKYYVQKTNYYLSNNKQKKAIKILNKGLKHYKNSLHLNKLIATIEMKSGRNKSAATYWELVIKKHAKHLKAEDFIQASENLLILKKNKQALHTLTKGLKYNSTDIGLLKKHSKQSFQLGQWKKVTKSLKTLFVSEKYSPTIEEYIMLSESYLKEKYGDKAEYIIQRGIQAYPDSMELMLQYIETSILLKKWIKASELISYVSKKFKVKFTNDQMLTFGMIHQLNGENEKAANFYDNILMDPQSAKDDEYTHKILTIFDNNETRIKFHKRNTKTNKVIITFDSLNMTWDKPSFGYKLLTEQNVDIITVQKKRKKTYQQDLSLSEFENAVKTLVSGYSTRISYGFSLGGYLALYYTGSLNCTILALAPRLSIHPIYGKPSHIGKEPFLHDINLMFNEWTKPIVVFDPKDKYDGHFVKNEVMKSYPNTKIVKIPYGGHSMGPHLLRMGQLKEFILTVIAGNKVPVYDRKKKTKSANYYRLLGRECLNRNKTTLAQELADRSYELLPEDPLVVRLKVDVLIQRGKYDEAEHYINIAIQQKPKRLSYRMRLIDIYILQGKIMKAEKQLDEFILIFGNRKQIRDKRIEINNKYQELVQEFIL